jgi:K+-sensing histidine kinase KdpD
VRGELLLANLLDHAATHTPAGAAIELTAKRQGRAVEIDVANHGIELRAEQMQQQATQRATRADALALAACHTIVSSYGGSIEASERTGGGGTVFHVHLPDGEALPDLAESLQEGE